MPAPREPDRPLLAALDGALGLPGFFAGFNSGTLSTFLPSFGIWTYSPEEPILAEGQEAAHFCVLLQGSAAVRAAGGREVAALGAGDSFGEAGVLAGAKRSASIVAKEPCLVATLNRRDLEKVSERHPELIETLEAQARERFGRKPPA